MRNRNDISLALGLLLVLLTGCYRRELYVYGDEFHSVQLEVDWREYSDRDPDGMTVWFYPLDDPSHAPYRTTTASVRRHDLYLPGGYYHGVVVDYSPEEYSRQEFLDMDVLSSARVESTPATYQPDSSTVVGEGVPKGLSAEVNAQLYGESAWNASQTDRPAVSETNGCYVVASQPEQMALDTLLNRYVDRGAYGDYIPWQERDTYQSEISITTIKSVPRSVIWRLRIRVWIKDGFNSLWQSPASITGLANGHFLPLDVNTDRPCIIGIDDWELERTGQNSGYLQVTLSTFGLRPATVLPYRMLHKVGATGDDWYDYYTDNCLPEDLRLNLSFTLRDHATTLYYHFDVGHMVTSYDAQQVLRLELGPDYFYPSDPDGPDPIVLPFVDAYNGTGFGADVTPWEDEEPVDITF